MLATFSFIQKRDVSDLDCVMNRTRHSAAQHRTVLLTQCSEPRYGSRMGHVDLAGCSALNTFRRIWVRFPDKSLGCLFRGKAEAQ